MTEKLLLNSCLPCPFCLILFIHSNHKYLLKVDSIQFNHGQVIKTCCLPSRELLENISEYKLNRPLALVDTVAWQQYQIPKMLTQKSTPPAEVYAPGFLSSVYIWNSHVCLFGERWSFIPSAKMHLPLMC